MNAVALCKFNRTVEGDLTLFSELALVTDQINTNILRGMRLDFFKPFAQTSEGLVASDIISQKDLVSTSIEDAGDRLERLLSSLQQSYL